MIPYGKQSISEEDILAVVETLRSDFLTCGPRVETFEQEFADFVGAKHAIAVCNATAALHLSMLVADIGSADRVITSPNTFLSSANCSAFVGATPDFCDIDSDTYTMDLESLKQAWSEDVRAVIPVAYAGQSADMKGIAEFARGKCAIVIEDASHGTGGGFFQDGKAWKQGGHPWADMTVFSFHPVKTLTTGEGGILVTDNDEYASKARLLRTHGMTRDSNAFQGLGLDSLSLGEQGPWYYEMLELGHNFRITDVQCALGSSQLKRLPHFIKRRQEIVALYNAAFADIDWIKTPGIRSAEDKGFISWHLYTLQIDFTAIGKTRSVVMVELRSKGIGTQVLYIPVYLQPYYRNSYGYNPGKCPNAEHFYSEALSLPLYPDLSDEDVKKIIAEVLELRH
ncbi:UDP-4-amino-4,6-dideoxy-N-acetyl-beta-L-altrosamine transaminase [Rubritalea marina]|uniref:UDP-4-amino-4, 6-dideoxy-N-acetyl-beta-L-altrosamine transaminase n=1 Tax=Rubritalea marina TaxID=361055 RepID=UPI0003780F8F|nr:UDP-4-amino-4,6-dideoxy-N-acetyl-beta-L-altrosamine transaminase [Rubritalea marina]